MTKYRLRPVSESMWVVQRKGLFFWHDLTKGLRTSPTFSSLIPTTSIPSRKASRLLRQSANTRSGERETPSASGRF